MDSLNLEPRAVFGYFEQICNIPHGSKLVIVVGNGEESLLKEGVVDENYFE